jgi:urease accessory protein
MQGQELLRLLQLVSPALPVGAYTYSEGLETLVQQETVVDSLTLEHWLLQELRYGAIRLEAAVLFQAYQCLIRDDRPGLMAWNQWLSAFRETEELREQSWQMGRSLLRLLQEVDRPIDSSSNGRISDIDRFNRIPCNFAIAFTLAAAHWQISPEMTVLGYLQSWAANLVNAGVRLIPLGQTQGQQVLSRLAAPLERTATAALSVKPDELSSCGWGLAIASMTHETLYSRLFRS